MHAEDLESIFEDLFGGMGGGGRRGGRNKSQGDMGS